MKDKTAHACLTCSMKSPLFNFLTEEELELITRTKKRVFFKAGEIIVKQGVPMSHVISFNQGLAKVYIEGSNDRNFILQFIKPTQFYLLLLSNVFQNQLHFLYSNINISL